MLARHNGILQEDGLVIREQALVLYIVAGNPEKAGSMPQPRDLAALNSLAVLLSLRGLSSIVVSMCLSHGPALPCFLYMTSKLKVA